jgi:hypothetical protein
MPDELTATFIYRFRYEPKGPSYIHLDARGAALLDQENLRQADSLMMLDLFFGGVEEDAMDQLTHLEEVVPHAHQRPIVLMPDGTLCDLGTDEETGELKLIERGPRPTPAFETWFPQPEPDFPDIRAVDPEDIANGFGS